MIIAYPSVLQEVSKLLYDVAKSSGSHQCDQVCGVPYTALPIATVISIDNDIPMVIRRKEAKDYGTKKMLEGVFEEGEANIALIYIKTLLLWPSLKYPP